MNIHDPKMLFKTWLRLSSNESAIFGQQFLNQKVTLNFRYYVILNQSNDDLANVNFDLYPEDQNRIEECDSIDAVAELLVRDEKIPVWIDVSIFRCHKEYSLMRLICAGRFTDLYEELYYYNNGTGCFGIKSPDLPVGYKDGTKFNLK